jgi:hypothetical protein
MFDYITDIFLQIQDSDCNVDRKLGVSTYVDTVYDIRRNTECKGQNTKICTCCNFSFLMLVKGPGNRGSVLRKFRNLRI